MDLMNPKWCMYVCVCVCVCVSGLRESSVQRQVSLVFRVGLPLKMFQKLLRENRETDEET